MTTGPLPLLSGSIGGFAFVGVFSPLGLLLFWGPFCFPLGVPPPPLMSPRPYVFVPLLHSPGSLLLYWVPLLRLRAPLSPLGPSAQIFLERMRHSRPILSNRLSGFPDPITDPRNWFLGVLGTICSIPSFCHAFSSRQLAAHPFLPNPGFVSCSVSLRPPRGGFGPLTLLSFFGLFTILRSSILLVCAPFSFLFHFPPPSEPVAFCTPPAFVLKTLPLNFLLLLLSGCFHFELPLSLGCLVSPSTPLYLPGFLNSVWAYLTFSPDFWPNSTIPPFRRFCLFVILLLGTEALLSPHPSNVLF